MMETPSFLREAVEDVYRAFKDVPLGYFEGCPCCVRDEHRQALLGPLRKIPDISHFAFKSMTTWGDEQTFKHFLPRILEAMTDAHFGINPQILSGKLVMAKWRSWPDRLRAPVEAWMDAYFRAALAEYPYEANTETALAVLVIAGFDLPSLLQQWSKDHSPSALRERVLYVYHWHCRRSAEDDVPTTAFWDLADDAQIIATLRDWMNSDDTRDAVEMAESLGLVGGDNYVPELAFWWPERIR
jgi:hypothetical protein